jgi:hypothetical protein
MRQTIFGLAAAIAVMAASSAPAMACGFGGCSPCGQEVFSPCAQQEVYTPPPPAFYNDCGGCGGWAHERLPNPVHQYYYVEQGPTYTGPGDWAPRRVYEENALPVWPYHHHHHYGHYHRYGYREYPLRRYY